MIDNVTPENVTYLEGVKSKIQEKIFKLGRSEKGCMPHNNARTSF